MASLDSDYECYSQSAVGLQQQDSDGEEQKELELRPSPMYRAGLAVPMPSVINQAVSVMQWMSLERLVHAGLCAEILFDVSSEQAVFPRHQRG